MQSMPMDDTHINTGGVMRCCIVSLLRLAEMDPKARYGDGDIVRCIFTESDDHRMVLFNGIWRWLKPEEAVLVPDPTRRG